MALKLLVLVALAAYKCDALPSATDLVVPEVIDRCHTESIADSLHPVIHGLSLSS